MHYYIDGYNVLFRAFGIGGVLEEQRKALIESLCSKIQSLNLDATIVFDAYQYTGERNYYRHSNVSIVFTPVGQDADEYILEALDTAPKPEHEIIITSDSRLAWRARCKGARTESVDDFLAWISKRFHKKRKKSNTTSAHTKVQLPVQLAVKKPKPKRQEATPEPKTLRKLLKKEPIELPIVQESDIPLEHTADRFTGNFTDIPTEIKGSFEYYLNAFEKNYDTQEYQKGELSNQQIIQHDKVVSKAKKKKIKPPPPTGESEMTRWQRIFEEREKPST